MENDKARRAPVRRRSNHPAVWTKEQWAEECERLRLRVEEVHAENRKIAAALDRITVTRDKLREQTEDLVAADLRELRKRLEEYEEHGEPHEVAELAHKAAELDDLRDVVEERDAMLRALGMDEHEWRRQAWKWGVK